MDREQRRALLRDRSAREKGIGLAYLVLIIGALVLALPLTGVISYDEPASDECAPGYSACLEPEATDYDCADEGNGPRFVESPLRVTGVDPFDLDPDHDGYGCDD
jgi:hypothetical protein